MTKTYMVVASGLEQPMCVTAESAADACEEVYAEYIDDGEYETLMTVWPVEPPLDVTVYRRFEDDNEIVWHEQVGPMVEKLCPACQKYAIRPALKHIPPTEVCETCREHELEDESDGKEETEDEPE